MNLEFVQDNHSLSVEQGVVRGLHFQIPPFAQDKVADIWEARCASDQRGGLEPVPRSGRIRARVLHAGAEYRGHLQGYELLFAGA